ncbi:MAG: toll/interleukin-1 receptor domain-containing protein, partial [bacterium]|nr:toll/interleukin-1 receptor domain-containing protein [bacterium]
MADEPAYDVFISYSHDDQEWVRGELLDKLKAAGLKVCIDFQSFVAGRPIVDEVERAVTSSQRTLLVMTPAYFESGWTEMENIIPQTLTASDRKHRLIPLLLTKCEIPNRLSYLIYVSFVEPDQREAAWRQLLIALGAPPVVKSPELPARATWNLVHPYPAAP